MKKGLTELVFVVDKSGSMGGLEADTIGGFNRVLRDQKEIDGECLVTTVFFNQNSMLLHDRKDIHSVELIGPNDYVPGGMTALLDAVGMTIDRIDNTQKRLVEAERTERVLFVIITDGQENSSREYKLSQVKRMIEWQKEKLGWEFIFLGANIDAVKSAESMGIAANRSQNFHADDLGMMNLMESVSHMFTQSRKQGIIDDDWNKEIRRDFMSRNSKR